MNKLEIIEADIKIYEDGLKEMEKSKNHSISAIRFRTSANGNLAKLYEERRLYHLNAK